MPAACGLTAHSLDQPPLNGVARLLDDVHAHRPLRHPLGEREGDERAAEAEHGGEDQQSPQVEAGAALVEDAVDPEQAQGDAQDHQDGDVGRKQQENAFHRDSGGVAMPGFTVPGVQTHMRPGRPDST